MAKQCERCGSGVPDANEKCQVCGAPMSAPATPVPAATPVTPAAPAAPAGPAASGEPVAGIPGIPTPSTTPEARPNYLQPTASAAPMGGDIRTSLTGEVMEVAQPSPRGTGPGGYGPPPGAPQPKGRGPAPAAGPARRYAGMPTEKAEAKSGSGGMVAIILVVLLLAGGGAFGWWWWQKQQAPVRAVVKVHEAAKANDWRTVFHMVELPEQFKQQIEMAGGIDKVADFTATAMKSAGFVLKDYQVLESKTEGDTATVKVKTTETVRGADKTETTDVKLKLVNGEWKVDLSSLGAGRSGMGGLGGM